MERIFDANWGVHTPTLQFGCFPLPSTSVFCGIFLRLNTFPLCCFRLAMNQTACSLKLHCQQSKNVDSSVEGADFVASSSLWTNLMHRRWLRFALRLPFACPVRIARGAPCAFCDTRFWSRIPAGQPQPSYAFRHVAPESLLHRLVHVFWRVDEALIDAMLGFCAQCRALQSRARSGRFHRRVRCWLHEQALTVPFDRGSVARDVVHDDTSIGRKIQTRKQVLD